MTDEKLSLYRVRILDMFCCVRILYYVMHSEYEVRKRCGNEYRPQSWRLDSITKIEEIDGHKISFLEESLDVPKSVSNNFN